MKVYVRRHKLLPDLSSCIRSANDTNKKMDPIDGSMVQATYEDRLISMKRPLPRTDFDVPIDCVGDLLMVWDFCISFGRFLHLSPFSLFDFESALCYKGRPPLIIMECCCALLQLLLKENEDPNPKVTEANWTEYLCDFLETRCGPALSSRSSHVIKRGCYGQLEIRVKLAILRELVAEVIETTALKNKVEDNFEERQALAAARRDEARYRCREVKSDQGHGREKKKFIDLEIEKRPSQNIPLGKDRNHNRYWFLRRDGRIYVEGPNFKHWGYYQTKDELDALIRSLNTKGVREKALKKQLKNLYKRICLEIERRPKEEMPSDGPSLSFLEYENTWKDV